VFDNKNRHNARNNGLLRLLACLVVLLVASCAHKSKVTPSTGHIDGKASTQSVSQANTATAAPIPKTVKNNPRLPIPRATTKAQTYSVVVNEVPVKEILFALARESKLNIDISPSIRGRATLNAVDQTLPAILERLARQVDLTYKMEGKTLYIAPDAPVLRLYKVDYVNMNRDTKGFIGVAAEITSTGQGVNISGGSSNTSNNSSRTSVESTSQNHLWESLIANIKDLLAETDKEVIVSRFGDVTNEGKRQSDSQTLADGFVNSAKNKAKLEADAAVYAEQRMQQKTEFKTLQAANVIANAETGVISVRATSRQHEKVQEFIDSVMGSAKRQVLIEATIVEVRLNDSYQAGIDWSRFGNTANSSGFTFQQSLGPTINPANGPGFAIGYLNPVSSLGNLAASVTLLKQFGDTKVISSPKLMVLNNQTAILKVVDNLVYFTTKVETTVNDKVLFSTVTTTPNSIPVGIVMSVTPQINDSSMVNINVRPTISRVLSFVRDPNPQLANIASQIPQIQVREMESILKVNSGNTAILGGLMQDEIQRNTDAVPGLSDIPGVGEAFKGRDNANRKTELVIFLRPTVITNASLESDELQAYKQYLPAQQLQRALEEAN
jgi:MSHA biogenesis protein MshL